MVVLFFGGIGTYYFKVFRWRHLEDPKYDLLVVKKTDNSELAFFRKKTVPEYVDPARMQLESLIKLRKATEKGTVRPEGFDQSMKEIGTKLLDIMNGAKLRQIPEIYEKKYIDVLVGISEIYRGWRDLEEVMATEIPEEKTRYLKSSIEHTKKAERLLKIQRQFFYVK